MNKKGLIIATGTVITALALSGCGTDNNAMNDRKDKVGYERVNFDNRPTNPYAVNERYVNDLNYPNNRDMYAKQNVHFGNDRINEGLNSEYKNDGIVRDGHNTRNANNNFNQYSLADQTRYNTNNNVNDNTLIPFTNINSKTSMSEGDRIYADQISKRVEQMTNVNDAKTIVVGDQLLVAVDLTKKDVDEGALRSKIKTTLAPYTSGKKVYVTFDGNVRNDIMNIPKDTNNTFRNTKNDVKDMYQGVKRGVKDMTNNN